MRSNRRDENPIEPDVLGGTERTIGRSLAAPKWIVPGVKLEERTIAGKKEQFLMWGFPGHLRPASSAKGLLDKFLELREADGETILRFAQKWGVLGLCEHHCPFTHNHRYEVATPRAIWQPCNPSRVEAVTVWRERAQAAYDKVHEAAELLREPPLSKIPPSERGRIQSIRQHRWDRVIGFAQNWLKESAVSWSLFVKGKAETWGEAMVYEPRHLQLVADFQMMFDVLAFQLCQAITRSEGLLVCDGCNQAFFRAWKPAVGKHVFCRTCGRNAAMRLYMRKKRAESRAKSISRRAK